MVNAESCIPIKSMVLMSHDAFGTLLKDVNASKMYSHKHDNVAGMCYLVKLAVAYTVCILTG